MRLGHSSRNSEAISARQDVNRIGNRCQPLKFTLFLPLANAVLDGEDQDYGQAGDYLRDAQAAGKADAAFHRQIERKQSKRVKKNVFDKKEAAEPGLGRLIG